MMDTATALMAVEAACYLDWLAQVEIENVIAVLGRQEVSHGACDAQDVELV